MERGALIFKSKSDISLLIIIWFFIFIALDFLIMFLIAPIVFNPYFQGLNFIIGLLIFIMCLVGSFLGLIYETLTFLKIYENGIIVRRSTIFSYLFPKYIPFEEIVDAEIGNEKKILKSRYYKREMTLGFLRIFVKKQESFKIYFDKNVNYKQALIIIKKSIRLLK